MWMRRHKCKRLELVHLVVFTQGLMVVYTTCPPKYIDRPLDKMATKADILTPYWQLHKCMVHDVTHLRHMSMAFDDTIMFQDFMNRLWFIHTPFAADILHML